MWCVYDPVQVYGLLTASHVLNPTLKADDVGPDLFEYGQLVHTADLTFAGGVGAGWQGGIEWLHPNRVDVAIVASQSPWPVNLTARSGMQWYKDKHNFLTLKKLEQKLVRCNAKSGQVTGIIYRFVRRTECYLLYIASNGAGIQPGDSGAVWYDDDGVIYAVQNCRSPPTERTTMLPPDMSVPWLRSHAGRCYEA